MSLVSDVAGAGLLASGGSTGRRKILCFDSWTRGAHHFERLVAACEERGFELLLVHLGSWGNDPGRPTEEAIGALRVRDIAYYRSISFRDLLRLEQPDAVILLSTETFAHRAMVRYCRALSVPTLLLYHGLVNVQVTDDRRGSYTVDRRAYARLVLSRLGRLATRTLPCYVGALAATRAPPADWVRFAHDMQRMAVGSPPLRAASDGRTSSCAVFTAADVDHAIRYYGFATEQISIVGNPDLARFGLTAADIGSYLRAAPPEARRIMYIDTGLTAVGLIFGSFDAYVDHVRDTAARLAAAGMQMLFKPHPAHDWARLERALSGSSVSLVANADFLRELLQCTACIVETTTLALVPAMLGMPLLLAQYGELRDLRFGPVLREYPRSHALRSLEEVPEVLAKEAERTDATGTLQWILHNAGPLPSEEMPGRVADVLAKMLLESRTAGQPGNENAAGQPAVS